MHALALAPLAAGETVPTGVARIEAANAREGHEASSVGVAVLDTGIDLDHPDLVAQDGKNCIASGSADDDNGHGTHVAGTIGARNQGAGVVGVAPGTTVYAVKVLDADGSGLWSNIICGIDWVTANAASLGIRVAQHEPRRPRRRLQHLRGRPAAPGDLQLDRRRRRVHAPPPATAAGTGARRPPTCPPGSPRS